MKKQEALDWAGGVMALAEKLGITPGAVSQWTEVPGLQQYRLWKLSAGKLQVDKEFDVKEQGAKR